MPYQKLLDVFQMAKTKNDHINRFNAIIEDCENFCNIARDSDLQNVAVTKLKALMADCKGLKSQAIRSDDEDFANLLLGFECVAASISSEIAMWILLKAGKPDEAWDELISAQMAATGAVRAHDGFSHVKQAERLEEIEKLVFPSQVFVSTGLIVRNQECSICRREYGDCEHLVGRPYKGEFCYIVARDIMANHVAVVKNPADKRCRIMHFTVEGGERNRMTWMIEPPSSKNIADRNPPKGLDPETEVGSRAGMNATARLLYAKG
jgi:hypothetical protein